MQSATRSLPTIPRRLAIVWATHKRDKGLSPIVQRNAIFVQWKNGRSGLTWVDVLISVLCTAVILAIIAPALVVQRSRPGRKFECMNNMRSVGMAVQNFASGSNGQLPFLTSEIPIDNDFGENGTMPIGWPIWLLPSLDNTALLKIIKRNARLADPANKSSMKLGEKEKIWLPEFTCPQDTDSYKQSGGLSYVVNAGFMQGNLFFGDPDGLHRLGQMSWDGNETAFDPLDIKTSGATGVIWRQDGSFQQSLLSISDGDGTTNTILLTENVHADRWYDTDTAGIGFGLPVQTKDVAVQFGIGTFFESVERPLNTEFSGSNLGNVSMRYDWQINAALKTEGTRARPSSNHQGMVNCVMCDGSVRFLSENIDPRVYIKLLTPNGAEYGEGGLPVNSY